MDLTLATLIILADLWAITRTLRSDASTQRKLVWVSIILLLPFVGMVIWILFGPS
ncbi:MAG: PLDc_N domain-containing protein [Gammaproteobacteria bacterium]|nr:PLDc_N domain-containing protein [Gammaproteobacteria bacterium]